MFALCIAYVFLFAFLIDFYGKLYYKITDKGITISFFDYSCFIPFNEIEKIEKVERVFPLTRFVLGGEVVYSNLGAVNLYSLNYFGNFILITLKCGLKYAVLPIEEDNFIKELSRRLT
ncbi:MAG: PH domain-containing protein [Nitrososphaeria archaeon]